MTHFPDFSNSVPTFSPEDVKPTNNPLASGSILAIGAVIGFGASHVRGKVKGLAGVAIDAISIGIGTALGAAEHGARTGIPPTTEQVADIATGLTIGYVAGVIGGPWGVAAVTVAAAVIEQMEGTSKNCT